MPSHATGARAAPHEQLLEVDEIQGNVIPGFMKPFMVVVGLTIVDVPRTRAWIGRTLPRITTLVQAMETRRRVREHRGLRASTPATLNSVPDDVDDAWLNLALSRDGMVKLLTATGRVQDVDAFTDAAFAIGLAGRSSLLGDPTDPRAPGHPSNWRIGGPDNAADLLLVFAADRRERLEALVAEVRGDAPADGCRPIYEEYGQKLGPGGAEHFGFKDGVSQPGVRGRYGADDDAYVTPRVIAPEAGPASWLNGLPGQSLVWPGEFVFGAARQGADPALAGRGDVPGPDWSRNGSYLVFRRLRQDVAGFRAFIAEQAAALQRRRGFEDMTPETLAAYLIGRWPSGAPVVRSPESDAPDLGADRLENNDFSFGTASRPTPLVDGGSTGTYPLAPADPIGLVCPQTAHIRKVNTRETGNDQGGRRSSFNRRLLRRGLPYGEPVRDDEEPDADIDRGILFLSYQASITDQFEFLASSWMGDPANPRMPSGFDMVIGQNGQPGEDRMRRCTLLGAGGSAASVTAERDFVIPTGGGYFFSPSLSALRKLFAD